MVHRNVRLAEAGRLVLVQRVLSGRPVSHLAKELGGSRQCAHRWVRRFQLLRVTGLRDRPSRARTHPRSRPAAVAARLLQLRRTQRLGQDKPARHVGLSPSTASRIITRAALPALHKLDPVTGIRNPCIPPHAAALRTPTARGPGPHRCEETRPHPRQWPLAARRAGHNRPQPQPDPVSQAWHELHPHHRRGPHPARVRPRPAG
ncbi:MAG: hypothetical protein B5766_13185 [Candidatus Lumbricidophila eiseniae]|uniref:Insertion element IS150 protein InsJ-like helix-turn-helix domain-containing protein n=1 Tax=Candidatus Lumbricidiphila eiseniae TaxID=1969409 RepID=A0A2A6FMF6_9MICO|nr:MAG: hypothetical protein B5766_13185 [Candidatus Lumbricidophila eiseniae]